MRRGERRPTAGASGGPTRPAKLGGLARIGFWRLGLMTLSGLSLMACAQPRTLADEQELIQQDPRRQARFQEGPPARVFLISVAGLRPTDYLDPFGHAAAEGALVHMPSLARLAREGVTVLGATPPVPGAVRTTHATLVTGLRPAGHRIVADATLDDEGTRALPFTDPRLLAGTPLWDAAIGRGVVSLGWPTTRGARIERLLPESDGREQGDWLAGVRTGASPAVWRALETIAIREREAIAAGEEDRSPDSWPTPAERDAALVEVACERIGGDRDAGLWLIRLAQTQPLMMGAGPGSVEVDDGFARIDTQIGLLVDCLEHSGKLAESAILVTGDVAYAPVHTTVSPNVALVKAGLIGRDPRAATGVRSWLALARSHGASAFVFARDAANALDARQILALESERTGAFQIVPAQRLAEQGADPQAWFGLAARPGFEIGDELVGPPLRASMLRGVPGLMAADATIPRDGQVGFVAWGRGVRNGVRMPSLDLLDVAPTIASLLGLRLDDDVVGKPVLGILRSALEPPPPGPKRLGGGQELDDRLREMRSGRRLGGEGEDGGSR